MSEGLLLGIDEGTTAVKAGLFELDLTPVALARRAVPVSHPRPGWVEQDPELILEAVLDTVSEVLQAADGREILAAGLDHQGESVMAWDADSLRPLSPVVVWQDKRQEQLLQEIPEAVEQRSGLPRDPYFSAGKLAWLLREEDEPEGPAGGRAATARNGRCPSPRPACREIRHRPLDGVANAAAGPRRPRLGRATAEGLRDRPVAASRARTDLR